MAETSKLKALLDDIAKRKQFETSQNKEPNAQTKIDFFTKKDYFQNPKKVIVHKKTITRFV